MEVDLSNAGDASLEANALSFGLLQIVSEARNEHGLRHHDYKLYHHFCAKKVHRLRQIQKVTHADDKHLPSTKQSKASSTGKKGKSSGKGRKTRQTPAAQAAAAKAQGPNTFTPKVLKAAEVTNERPALLLLFEAERAWAHSQEYRERLTEVDGDPKVRKLGLSRLKRAVEWADQLVALLRALPEQAVDAQLVAEAVAYRTLLEGIRHFDRGSESSHEAALPLFCASRVLLNAIAKNSPTSRREALAYTFVDQGEAPLRFCAYQLGLNEQLSDLDVLAKEYATPEKCEEIYPGFAQVLDRLESSAQTKSGKEQKRSVKIDWHGRELPIRNPDLLEATVKVQAEQERLSNVLEASKADDTQPRKRGKRQFVRLSHAERRAKRRNAPGTSGSGARSAAIADADPYDNAIVALGEAIDISQQLIAENQEALSKSHTERFAAASTDLQLVHDYIQYELMSLRVARADYLINNIEKKAERQEALDKATLEKKLALLHGTATASGSSSSQKTGKDKPKRVSAIKKVLKKRPNVRRRATKGKTSKAKPKGSTKKVEHRRSPARSGTRALRVRQRAVQARQLRDSSLEEARRQVIQSVPGLARLYDGAEISVSTIATLGLVESDPEISSLVDAKAAWYRAEMLRMIARAYALSGSYAQALLLLTRASLFVRQARQSLSLVATDGSSDEAAALKANSDFPPVISSDVLDAQDSKIQSLTRATQREMFLGQNKVIVAGSADAYVASRRKVTGGGGGGVATDASRLGTALRDLANKYVDFDDPIDLQQAASLPEEVQAELQEELDSIYQKTVGSRASNAGARQAKTTAAASAAADHADVSAQAEPTIAAAVYPDAAGAEADTSAGPYDPANDADYEAEAQQPRGWFGGWFGRK
ncbi:signal recognition particle subunit srp68 [Tilletia horrida]|nr:signal recognition particle subunit srp68 [Tilletia horrida]